MTIIDFVNPFLVKMCSNVATQVATPPSGSDVNNTLLYYINGGECYAPDPFAVHSLGRLRMANACANYCAR